MKKIGIGYEDYKRFTDDELYYIDKTMLISDIVNKGGVVTLFTRPRRFGKTLALSMLRTFFELEYDRNGNIVDNRRYFEGKRIMNADDKILSMMGRYPVINLSLKSAKQPSFFGAFVKLRDEIYGEITRHDYLKTSSALSDEDKAVLADLMQRTPHDKLIDRSLFEMELNRFSTAIKSLSYL